MRNQKEEAFVYGIPKCFIKWASDRGYRTDYGGFVCYLQTLITMDSDKQIYQIPDGYFINHLLQGKVGEDKRYIFRELKNVSLRRIMNYCYADTVDRCAGTDECY